MAGDNNAALPPLSSTATKPTPTNKSATPPPNASLLEFIHSIIANHHRDEAPFYVLDLALVASLINRWSRHLPTVRPFFAVKCHPDPSLIGKMAELGCGFDCASRNEIEAVLSLGISPDRIIFANTCKYASHIKYAAQVGVNLTTFDSEVEVQKIRKHHKNCELVIRIKSPEDSGATFDLMSKKFGALPEEVEPLLRAAKAAQLSVVGVSFHIGSGAARCGAFTAAIEMARKVFDVATRIGLPKMRLLDIGGGFTADEQLFESAAETINSSISQYFGDEPELTVIAEPGRFFAAPVFTLAAAVIGKRVRGELREYWISDGIHGSIKFPFGTVNPTPFACASIPRNPLCRGEMCFKSTVYGPTCAGDAVLTEHELPVLGVDDWLIFPKMGAYTKARGSNFNGFNNDSILTYLLN